MTLYRLNDMQEGTDNLGRMIFRLDRKRPGAIMQLPPSAAYMHRAESIFTSFLASLPSLACSVDQRL
jgi:hypothetical protein